MRNNKRLVGEPVEPPTVKIRCAIYTRKSTEEGLAQDFNSLDAQREAAEAYIASQRHEGWATLPDRYDDGGFTGANIDRPAMKRLLADIEAKRIDCVVVYKVDRLSRSLLDFARMMEIFERHSVSFVSVTQQFNTTASLGRLTLNILLSFAQFEREIIGERTRDKMCAARRKGKWIGGIPMLGYDVDPKGGRLLVNEHEAEHVRAIFDLYLEHRALIPVVREINARGWITKSWMTKDGRDRKGEPFTKNGIFRILTSAIYTGHVKHKNQVYQGEHPAIIDAALWQSANQSLIRNGTSGTIDERNKHGALLKGLLRCQPCGAAMLHTYTMRGGRKYRYYVCLTAQQRGWDACPTKSVAAHEMEQAVVDHLRGLGKDRQVLHRTLTALRQQNEARQEKGRADLRNFERESKRLNEELVTIASTACENVSDRLDRMADIQDQLRAVAQEILTKSGEMERLKQETVDEDELARALADFEPVWGALNTAEQTRLVRAIVDRVEFDGTTGRVGVTFRSSGLKEICAIAEVA